MIFKYLDIKLFLISLSVGLLYIYLAEEYKKVILIYPTPTNANTTQYKDKTDECFEYKLTEVKCPSQFQTIPSQR
jgi:hypothetical protein